MNTSGTNPRGATQRNPIRSSPRTLTQQQKNVSYERRTEIRTVETFQRSPSHNREFDPDDGEQDSMEYNLSGNTSAGSWYADLREQIAREQAELKDCKSAFNSTGSPARKHETSHEQAKASSFQDGTTTLNWSYISIGMIVSCVLIAIALLFMFRSGKNVELARIECPQFKELTKEFKNQDKMLFRSLKVGIEKVLNENPAEPSVFLLAYNDPKISQVLMNKILNISANCMKSQNPIQLEGGTFATEIMQKDYGRVITEYRKRLENEGIMYVSNIEQTPSKAAQAFHTFCDTVTPLVERSVIFFTMYVEQYDRNMSPNQIHKMVEHRLESNWDAVNHNNLNALIGRVTDQVFLLHSETF